MCKYGGEHSHHQWDREFLGLDGGPESNTDAAGATLAGRVLSASEQPIAHAFVWLTRPNGETLMAQTGSFGYYVFSDIPTGALYTLTVKAGRFTFAQPSRTVELTGDLLNTDFVADPCAGSPILG